MLLLCVIELWNLETETRDQLDFKMLLVTIYLPSSVIYSRLNKVSLIVLSECLTFVYRELFLKTRCKNNSFKNHYF